MLQQPGYKFPVPNGKMHLMPPGGHLMGKMLKQMHMRRVADEVDGLLQSLGNITNKYPHNLDNFHW